MVADIYTNIIPPDFSKMKIEEKIIWRSGQFSLPDSISKEKAYGRLMKRVSETKYPSNLRVIDLSFRNLIAAAIVGFIFIVGGLYVWNHMKVEEVVAAKGHQTDYRLPDGSMVSLNADTKISYHKGNFNRKRSIEMDGEAFFNIEKGSPFVISTGMADIHILGTSFNLYARENSFKVSCFSGKIRVTAGSQTLIVSPMEMAVIENYKLILYHNGHIHNSTGWRTGEFNFENASLISVFDEIERQYNVNFVLPEIDTLFFTGSISNKNLVNALDIVCITMGLTYEIGSNGKVLINSKAE